MTQKPVNSFKRKKQGGSRYAALAIVVLILTVVVGYWVARQPEKKVANSGLKPGDSVSSSSIVPEPAMPPSGKSPESSQVIPPPAEKKLYPETNVISPDEDSDSSVTTSDKRSGKLAIIIDDMGTSVQEARALAAIGVPLTFSIIPGLRSYKEVAVFSDKNGIETMIHIPMQSKGWPERRLEANGLLISMDEAEIKKRVNAFTVDLPRAIGVNNHMGSEFTEHGEKMRAALAVLKEHNLFFVDSVTSPKSVSLTVAKELGLRSARRAVFLDNEQNETYIRGQLQQAVRQAKKHGSIIAICHPHPATIATLAKTLPTLNQQGITLIAASAVVR